MNKKQNDLSNEWLTIRQVARILNVNERTVRRMITYGELPHIGKDRIRLIPRSNIADIKPRKVGQRRPIQMPDNGQH